MKTNKLVILAVCVILTFLTACQRSSDTDMSSIKNDDSFEAAEFTDSVDNLDNVQETQPNTVPSSNNPDQLIQYSDSFSSTDNSVEFRINLENSVTSKAMPVVEVVPHYITEEEAQRVAHVLFGNVDFFEADPMLAPKYTKGEILERIQRWSQYTNLEAVGILLGQEDERTVERLNEAIEELNALYESAPEDSERTPCQWQFQNDSVYTYSPEEAASRDQSSDNEAIMATCKVNGINYRFEAVTRNKEDYKLNMLNAYINPGNSPLSIDENIFRARLTRTAPPTEEQIATVQSKAMTMLQEMDLGEWEINRCYVRSLGETIFEHVICIDAVPVINNVAAAQQPQITGLSNEAYSSNYYMTEVNFEFSANGDLIRFTMYSPIDVERVINEDVAILGVNTLLDKAKEHLALSNSQQYGLQDIYGVLNEKLEAYVEINDMRYGLLREKAPDTDDSYYYFPGFILYGTVQSIDSESKQLYFQSDESYPLVALNAVDGTVINSVNQ